MSSQGSSNIRIFSGNAFEGDSLSQSISTPDISSIESSTPQATTRQEDMEVVGPSREQEASTSSHEGDGGNKEEVEASCQDLVSTFSFDDAKRFTNKYRIKIITPREFDKAHHPFPNYVATSEAYSDLGSNFPESHSLWRSLTTLTWLFSK